MFCQQCYKNKSHYARILRDDTFCICKECALSNSKNPNTVGHLLFELNYLTYTKRDGADRALYLLLKRYEKELPYIDFNNNKNPGNVIINFIKSFRQTDVIEEENVTVLMDSILHTLLNARNEILYKALTRIQSCAGICQLQEFEENDFL